MGSRRWPETSGKEGGGLERIGKYFKKTFQRDVGGGKKAEEKHAVIIMNRVRGVKT